MNFIEASKAYFVKWNDFKSRSSRSEYWWATLFVSIASYPAGFIIGFVISITLIGAGFPEDTMYTVIAIAILPLQLFIYFASACLVIRRLHDLNMSGWWWLLIFTIIGIIPVIYWLCKAGDDGDNNYGSNPLKN
tara:strand:+ start:238 stop:639 length:402 start_codon:yes stop_codon:yes gene_type:complete